MKKTAAVVMASSVLTLAVVEGLAQQRPADRPASPTTSIKDTWSSREVWRNAEGVHETKTIIGTRVKGPDGKVTHAIVGLGGFAGIGERRVVVPWSEIKLTADAKNPSRMIVSADPGALDKAPRYERRTAATDRTASPAASPSTAPRMEPKPAEPKK